MFTSCLIGAICSSMTAPRRVSIARDPAPAAITHKRNGFALPFKKRAVERVLEDRCRTVIVLGDCCDEGIELADTLAPSFRFRLAENAACGHRRRRLIEARQPIIAQVKHCEFEITPL